jgi:hypothetical protein
MFGIYKSSVKKITVLNIKKIVRNGVNMKLPTTDISEIGIPHAARIGREVMVAIACIFRNVEVIEVILVR